MTRRRVTHCSLGERETSERASGRASTHSLAARNQAAMKYSTDARRQSIQGRSPGWLAEPSRARPHEREEEKERQLGLDALCWRRASITSRANHPLRTNQLSPIEQRRWFMCQNCPLHNNPFAGFNRTLVVSLCNNQ